MIEKNKENTKESINENMIIGKLLDRHNEVSKIFLDMGMHCLSCPTARQETIKEACEVHGVDVNDIMEKIKKAIK